MQERTNEGLIVRPGFRPDDAMGVYRITNNNRDRLKACKFDRVEYNEQLRATVFIFNDPYRKINIDILFTGQGELLISDFYGETMKRAEIWYIRLS